MYLLLIRHLESSKNIRETFSSSSEDEPLTEIARTDLTSWSHLVCQWVHMTRATVAQVYSTASIRAEDTAASIAKGLGVPVMCYQRLRSTHPGSLAGRSADDARMSNPEFMEQLHLYRKGLFNSYDFTVADSKEPKRSFEERIASCLDEILNVPAEELKIVVAHRAPITAVLMAVARSAYQYPRDFFGYVELTLGYASLLERTLDGEWRIHEVNVPVHELPDLTIGKRM